VRHRRDGRKFGRNPAQRKAMLRQLAVSMILHERIMTTEAKAKELGPIVEKLVTIARDNSLHHRRLIMERIDHERAMFKLVDVIAPRYEGVDGGYTRISKLGPRRGDAAPMALIEFVDEG
jgi:large subunit ribosomal protein L17